MIVLVAPIAWMTTNLQPDFAGRQLYLRAGSLLAALGCCFALDDTAAITLEAVPVPLRTRRVIRTLPALFFWVATIAIVISAGSTDGLSPVLTLSNPYDPTELPVGRLLLEAATLASWGVAIAAGFARNHPEPGRVASVILVILYGASWTVPHLWKPWADPTVPRWTTSLPWWWVALAVGVTLTVLQSWDSRRIAIRRRG